MYIEATLPLLSDIGDTCRCSGVDDREGTGRLLASLLFLLVLPQTGVGDLEG